MYGIQTGPVFSHGSFVSLVIALIYKKLGHHALGHEYRAVFSTVFGHLTYGAPGHVKEDRINERSEARMRNDTP